MRRKRIIELSRRARAEAITGLSTQVQAEAEWDQKESEFQESTVLRKVPETQRETKTWKATLGWEWMWFACSLLGSWLLANIMEIIVPAETIRLAIGIFVLVYAGRLTVWAIKEMGKG